MNHKEVFTKIYREGLWGDGSEYCSGSGSLNPKVTGPYVAAVSCLLREARGPVIDIGCGDFRVGAELYRSAPHGYVGVDVVEELISSHKATYRGIEGLSFVCADLTKDALPQGDIAVVRQVLQHLSNPAVLGALERLKKYRVCIVTEHQPARPVKVNADKWSGPRVRLEQRSGIYLELPPFSVPGSFELLLEVPGDGLDPERSGLIRTFVWKPPILEGT